MIQKLNHKNKETSCEIRSLFQASYRIEARLLKASHFPPLNRELVDFLNSDTEFYGFFKDTKIAAVVEVNSYKNTTDIESLAVHPAYFRQGLGKQLMQFILNAYDSEIFTVETGLENKPAIKLYNQLGFYEQEQWDTEFGVRKIRLKKQSTTRCENT